MTRYRPINDAEMFENISALTRSAALKTLEKGTGLEGLADSRSEAEFDAELERAIGKEYLQGMQSGELYAVSEPEFDAELQRLIIGEAGLDGWFKKLRRRVSKNVKRIGRQLRPKKIARSVKRLAVRVRKATTKVAKKAFKVIKKVAPYAAGAAALYFGGPYALAALKSAGGAVYGGAKLLAGKIFTAKATSGAKVADIMSPKITEVGTSIAQQLLKRKGVNMASPQAKQILGSYIAGQQARMAPYQPTTQLPYTQQPPPKPSSSGNIAKFLIPAAAIGGALLLTA